jgi:hypothetical protein
MAEQGTHKPLVVSSNLTLATSVRPKGRFLILAIAGTSTTSQDDLRRPSGVKHVRSECIQYLEVRDRSLDRHSR